MSETISLESPQFKNIEYILDNFFLTYLGSKKKIPITQSKISFLDEFQEDIFINMKRFCHEYDMSLHKRGNKHFITAELTPEIQQYVVYVSRFQCLNSKKLNPARTIQGKNAEAVVMCAINSFLNYFRIRNSIKLNTKSFRYGGDLGYDFVLGQYRFDVKHRDDSPYNGLILRDSFLNKTETEDDVILIFVTNAADIKLGTYFNKILFEKSFNEVILHLKEQVLPMAIVGWMTIGEYKKKKVPRGGEAGAWVVDDLNPICDLFTMIAEDQILSEDWLV